MNILATSRRFWIEHFVRLLASLALVVVAIALYVFVPAFQVSPYGYIFLVLPTFALGIWASRQFYVRIFELPAISGSVQEVQLAQVHGATPDSSPEWRAFWEPLQKRLLRVLEIVSILTFDAVILLFGYLVTRIVGSLYQSDNPFYVAAPLMSASVFFLLYVAAVLIDFWDFLKRSR